MIPMRRSSFIRLIVLVAGFALAVSSLSVFAQQDTAKRGRKFKAPEATARIEVTVLRDVNGKPIENAAVIFHTVGDKGNMELKSNEDGKAVIDVLPLGSNVRLQVIAKGFQTYGEDFKIDKPELVIEVKMKRPGEQYSIYKSHGEAADADKTASPAKDAAPAVDKTSAKQPDAQPSQPQPK